MTGNDIRKGMYIKYESKLYQVMSAIHRTPGNLRAFMQVKLRNLDDGTQKDVRFSATEKIETIDIFERKMQFLYGEGESYHFMDTENYEQVELYAKDIGDDVVFLQPEMEVHISFYESKAMGVRFPQSMEFEVVECDPEIKGATATAQYKPAKLSNGIDVKVPGFVNVGDWIKINTETREYQERVKK